MPARRARERVPVGKTGVEPDGSGYRRRGLLSRILCGLRDVSLEFVALLILATGAAIVFGAIAVAAVYLWAGKP